MSESPQQINTVPVEQNPFLDENPIPANQGTTVTPEAPHEQQVSGNDIPGDHESTSPQPPTRLLRWTAPLAGVGLVARGNWSQQVEAALKHADDRAWQRLRRAGRLGKASPQGVKKRGPATANPG
jgi:hypothetical protein